MSGREPDLAEQLSSLGRFRDRDNTTITPLAIEAEPWLSKSTRYGGTQHLYRFANGYGASVVQGIGTYGGEQGKWELGVMKFDGEDYSLTYDTPVTGDVIGWLDPEGVAELLVKIAALPEAAS